MRHVSCDLCTKDLTPGTDARYTISIDARLTCDSAEWRALDLDADGAEVESDTDHIDAMDEMLADLPADDTVDESDELPLPVAPISRTYDLCGRCYRRFAADPLGHATRRRLSFSAN